MGSVEKSMINKLSSGFSPKYLEVINESYMHSVPAGSETHFKVVMVADSFQGKRQVQRHQAIYACLADNLKTGVHALALHTYSPQEWLQKVTVPESPACLGGSKHDHSI